MLSSCIAYLLNRATIDVQVEKLIDITTSLNDLKFFGDAFSLSLQYETLDNVIAPDDACWSLTLWKNVQTLLK